MSSPVAANPALSSASPSSIPEPAQACTPEPTPATTPKMQPQFSPLPTPPPHPKSSGIPNVHSLPGQAKAVPASSPKPAQASSPTPSGVGADGKGLLCVTGQAKAVPANATIPRKIATPQNMPTAVKTSAAPAPPHMVMQSPATETENEKLLQLALEKIKILERELKKAQAAKAPPSTPTGTPNCRSNQSTSSSPPASLGRMASSATLDEGSEDKSVAKVKGLAKVAESEDDMVATADGVKAGSVGFLLHTNQPRNTHAILFLSFPYILRPGIVL